MSAPLARDQHGNAFELPQDAAFWRVRRHTGGRPSTVLGPDGEPLFVPIMADRHDLHSQGCAAGSLRLEAVDEEYHPVNAPVAFVELSAPRNAAPNGGDAEYYRVSHESMTRVIEAMQRAQVERERTLAQKERALTDVVVALVERSGGSKPQEPLDVLKQQLAFQRALEQGKPRNAELSPAVEAIKPSNDNTSMWRSFAPLVATTLQEIVLGMFAKDDPEKASQLRHNIGTFAGAINSMMGAAVGSGSGEQATPEPASLRVPIAVGVPTAGAEAADDEAARPRPRKAMREVFAQLDDEEADMLDEYLDDLPPHEYDAVMRHGAAIASIDERTAWTRSLMLAAQGRAPSNVAAPTSSPRAGTSPIPPALLPLLAQLTPAEMSIGAQIVSTLDPAIVKRLTDELASMPPDQALSMVRRIIAETQTRAAPAA